ncbi:RHS repeat-associated core domain-containing protein [Streptomyces sp. Isolate_45]|uniref:RHS repeat domain-containing protein n=1 Tax=Streptomyces sp. Isolate_45 TaxID=2950111 RepID=UPI002481ECB1|nr:RHS repeat-associated core domain-containing protein [Streptomyces sp. Isolate_45]MDA5281984.1 RHS repeat-associated core domain-containing protein [Streptomyces sp. Isolate_45]
MSGQRSTERTNTGTPTTRAYCYDPARPHTLAATTTGGTCAGVPAQYAYDAAGNTTQRTETPGGAATQSLAWTLEGKLGRLTEGGTVTDYLYDAEGQLLIRRDANGETVLYTGATEVHMKGAKKWATRSYVLGGSKIAVRTNESGSAQLSFTAGDNNGTTTLVVSDDAGQTPAKRYTTVFGAPRGSTPTVWPDDKRFLDKPVDGSTGLTHIGVREYDPLIGRFLSVDPVLITASAQSLNGYGYANNNPVTTSDPSGACAELDCPTRGPNGHNDTPLPAKSHAQKYNTGAQSSRAISSVAIPRATYHPGTATGGGPLGKCTQGLAQFCGPLYGAPPVPLAPPLHPGPPPMTEALNCPEGDMAVDCLTEVSSSHIMDDPFNEGNRDNGANELAYEYSSLTTGCVVRSAQYVCFQHSPGLSQPMTVGDVLFYPSSRESYVNRLNWEWDYRQEIERLWSAETAASKGPDLERHEAVHSRQWATFSQASFYITDCMVESGKSMYRLGSTLPAHANKYEVEANLWWGGYLTLQEWQAVPVGGKAVDLFGN